MIRFLLAAAVLAMPGVAMAQPQLVSSSPAAKTTASKPTRISLGFSEKLIASASGFDLIMTGMPGMADHPPMPIKGFTASVGPDGKSLVATLPRALPAGSYDLNWHATGSDQAKAQGRYSFTVK
jgi:methionine-rich copper-binding protein CopC